MIDGSDGRNRFSGKIDNVYSRISVVCCGDVGLDVVDRFDDKWMFFCVWVVWLCVI